MADKPNILIVDDDKNVVEVIAEYIAKRYAANIDTASNGEDAVKIAKSKKYDIILLDIKMPAMDGIMALSAIKKNNKSIHAIMITSWHSSDVLNDAMEAGADAFLVKPVKPNILKNRLDSALTRINKLKHLM